MLAIAQELGPAELVSLVGKKVLHGMCGYKIAAYRSASVMRK